MFWTKLWVAIPHKGLRIFRAEIYKFLRLFRCGSRKPHSLVELNVYEIDLGCFGFWYSDRKSLHHHLVWAGGESPHCGERTGKKKTEVPPSAVGGATINLVAASRPSYPAEDGANRHRQVSVSRLVSGG